MINLRVPFALLALAALFLAPGCRSWQEPSVKWTLTGTVWKVVEINGQMAGVAHIPTLQLESGGNRVSAVGAINRLTGTYTLKDDMLSFGPLASTRMAGTPQEMKLDQQFAEMLGKVTHYRARDQWLVLLAGEVVLARAQALPAKPFGQN